MKGKGNFGYKVLLFIALVAALAHAAAHGHKGPLDFYEPDPNPDTPANNSNTAAPDSLTKNNANNNPPDTFNLRFPIHDETGDPTQDARGGMDLQDPPNVKKTVDYDPDSQRYYFNEKLGGEFLRNPTYLTMDEYLKYQAQQDEQNYWQRRLDAITLFNKKPELPQMYKDGLFDRIFGSNSISVKPQGNVDVTFGGSWQDIKNPTLVQRAQKYGIFDFDMQMNINLLATVGDKLKLQISNNTKATFDYQNVQKLDYTGKEDEIIKKIEAGNVSFPLKSNLITGVQSLFGLKTTLQFGKLWVTGVLSQQKSQRKSLTIQGGAQTQQFNIKADNYEENKDFLLGQYFYNNYNTALANFPVINSLVTMNKIEVWVTNRTGAVTGVRGVLALADIGEASPYLTKFSNPNSGIKFGLPDNTANRLYTELLQDPNGRMQSGVTTNTARLGLLQGQDYEVTTARQLSASEYTFNSQLGYILLNTQLNSDDVLGVAYRYTYNGKVYQVGEFAEDLPPDTTNQKVIYLKLLKGTSQRPGLPIWNLMMKNVYALGGAGLTKDNFTLNVMYQDPGGGEIRYLPEGPNAGVPLLTLLNLDRLNSQNQAQPDGVFDFVDGITVNSQQGKVIFPVLQPFGRDLAAAVGNNPVLERKYLYTVLYDSTKTVAQEQQSNDRYILQGSYKSSSSSEIFLGGFNIPPGSVTVTAGGTKLVENQDYQIDYGLGRLKIINTGILNSGVPINVQYEDNSTFGFTQQNFMGARLDYYVNKNLTIGSTLMRLTERPFTQTVSYGEDPIKNTVLGADINYQSELPAVTRALDKLPIYSTTAPSFIKASGEVATLMPNHPKQIDALDPEGSVYIDNFEGATSTYDMKLPSTAWSLASTPFGAVNKAGQVLFPESVATDQLSYGYNRAKLAWYTIEPTLIDGTSGLPSYVKNDPNQDYIRLVQEQDVFPQVTATTLQTSLSTFDLGYYPNQKGPYNYSTTNVNADGTLANPINRWGGIMRPITNTDFEASNVEYIQFWVMDPFIGNSFGGPQGGSIYFDLGDVSEDVLKDSRLFFENGIPYPFDRTQLDTTAWGYVPKFEQQITRAFNNDPNARAVQDVGYDGLDDPTEQIRFAGYIATMAGKGLSPAALQQIRNDPSNDDYLYYRDASYDQNNTGILGRYKQYNNPQGNSPIANANASYSSAETTIPESEDIDQDNTLNEDESYYQYRVDLSPNMNIGTNNIVDIETPTVQLPNGSYVQEKWYQFKIPIENYDHVIGGISDFRSIRFMRMFLSGWQDSVILRFATLELGRNQWRNYNYSLETPGEQTPQQNATTTSVAVTTVSVEENSERQPIPYVMPPGVNRQIASVSNGQTIQQNEQSLSLRVCPLQDGDARAVYKEVGVDMRQFTYLRMFMHAESEVGEAPLNSGDVYGFIRIGSDFTNNYYEYRVPLVVTQPGATNPELVWPTKNNVNLVLQTLVNAKTTRDSKGLNAAIPYQITDDSGNTIIIVGNPNIGNATDIMLGILNPKKAGPGDDGLAKCTEVWFDEMRMAGVNDKASYAAAGKVSLQLADLGNVNLSGSMHTAGYGSIDQNIEQRAQDNAYQYNASSNLSLGKLFPKSWGLQLPLFLGYTQNVSTPKYDPYDQDVVLTDELRAAQNAAQRDSMRKAAQDFTSITSINLANVRVLGANAKSTAKRMPWDIKNFDFSYSFSDQYKHNPTISADNLTNNKVGLGYTYAIKIKPIEPFKNFIKSKSKWFALIKDFNFTPLPSNFTFRTNINSIVEMTQVRDIDETDPYQIPATFYKNFTWNRNYTLRWELTRSLSLDYTAANTSMVTQPYGYVDNKVKQDSLLNSILTFGQNTYYTQTFNGAYNVPLQKLPLTDWMNLRLGYTANYSWTAAAPVAYTLGNTIGNTVTKTVAGDLNFQQLYNKSRWLRALNQTAKPPAKDTKNAPSRNGGNGKGGAGSQNVKDLRGNKNNPNGPNGTESPSPNGGGSGGGSGGNGSSGGGSGGNGSGGGSGGNDTGSTSNFAPSPSKGGGNKNNTNNNNNNNSSNNNNNNNNNSNSNGTNNAGNNGNGKGGNNNGNGGGNGNNKNGNANNSNNSSDYALGYDIVTNTADLSDHQLDSMVQLQADQDAARRHAEWLKRKQARKAARLLRRNTLPKLNTTEQIIGHILTMVNRATINYTENEGTILPGYMDSTRFMGVNNYSGAPGFNFVYGYQPNTLWLAQQAAAGRLSRDSLFNAQFQQQFTQNLNITTTLQPVKDLKIDLSLTRTFSKSSSELYKDTLNNAPGSVFNALDLQETGSFNVSYISLKTMFKSTGANSGVYNQFLANLPVLSKRLGTSNPYTNGLPDPTNPLYTKGYTQYSQDVLIPSFLAAFSGKNASNEPLIDYSNANNTRSDPFKYFIPMPNWRFTYNGLAKIPFFAQYVSNLVINHSYIGSMSMNGFSSNLLYQDLYGLGFPSFLDSNSHNYVPFYQVPNVTISQSFNPLIGIDATLRNNITAKFEVRTSRMESLSLIDYQISETSSTEYVIGAGYRIKGLELPFSVFGVQRLKNELIVKLDLGFRNDISSDNYLANNINETASGQKVIRISPTIDYSVNKKLTLHFFYDRQQTIPYVSNSYPITNTRAGVTLRFIFAQ